MKLKLASILRICEARQQNSVTDRMFYNMIDDLASRFFFLGLALGIGAGVAIVAFMGLI